MLAVAAVTMLAVTMPAVTMLAGVILLKSRWRFVIDPSRATAYCLRASRDAVVSCRPSNATAPT